MCTDCLTDTQQNVTFASAPFTVGQRAAFDKLDEIGTCWRALWTLMPSDQALDAHDRDAVAVLMGHLSREYEAASATLRSAVFAAIPKPL